MTGDYYVFAYSWQPEYCYGKTSYPGCTSPDPSWNTNFTVHGLWPQYSSSGYPSTCTTEAYNSSSATDVGWDDMVLYWPDVEYSETSSSYTSFWEHEWTKHGTCTGLSQDAYFQAALNLIKAFGTPASVTNAVGKTVSADTVRNEMGGATYVSLQCTSGSYLSGAYTCWGQSNGIPTTQQVCASDVQKEDTCTSSTLTVESF